MIISISRSVTTSDLQTLVECLSEEGVWNPTPFHALSYGLCFRKVGTTAQLTAQCPPYLAGRKRWAVDAIDEDVYQRFISGDFHDALSIVLSPEEKSSRQGQGSFINNRMTP